MCANLLITTAAPRPDQLAEPLRVVGEPRRRPDGPVLGLRQDDRPDPRICKDVMIDDTWVKEGFDLHCLVVGVVYNT